MDPAAERPPGKLLRILCPGGSSKGPSHAGGQPDIYRHHEVGRAPSCTSHIVDSNSFTQIVRPPQQDCVPGWKVDRLDRCIYSPGQEGHSSDR